MQRVIEKGGRSIYSYKIFNEIIDVVYVVTAAGNSGNGGLFTVNSPSIPFNTMSVGSVDNTYNLKFYGIIAPDGSKILYAAGTVAGGWKSVVNTTIVVNSQSVLNHNN